ncbi:MAG: hypothetical protein VX557_01835, partial [Candidatus Thermoplasmatota archaeon]|nr:hypothetical protein [Candidatus Thermoplasmatota archaeon]
NSELGKGLPGKLILRTGQDSSSARPTKGLSSAFFVLTVEEIASLTDPEFMYTYEEEINRMVTDKIRKILLDAIWLTSSGR